MTPRMKIRMNGIKENRNALKKKGKLKIENVNLNFGRNKNAKMKCSTLTINDSSKKTVKKRKARLTCQIFYMGQIVKP